MFRPRVSLQTLGWRLQYVIHLGFASPSSFFGQNDCRDFDVGDGRQGGTLRCTQVPRADRKVVADAGTRVGKSHNA